MSTFGKKKKGAFWTVLDVFHQSTQLGMTFPGLHSHCYEVLKYKRM